MGRGCLFLPPGCGSRGRRSRDCLSTIDFLHLCSCCAACWDPQETSLLGAIEVTGRVDQFKVVLASACCESDFAGAWLTSPRHLGMMNKLATPCSPIPPSIVATPTHSMPRGGEPPVSVGLPGRLQHNITVWVVVPSSCRATRLVVITLLKH